MTASSETQRGTGTAALFALAVFLFVLTFSISLPIYIRPFYYAHIEALDLPRTSGFSADQIREAYDQVLDYLTIPGRGFGTGDMAWSESGKAHFEDCRVLFNLNAAVLMSSAVCILVLLGLRRMGRIGPLRLGRRSAAAWAALAMLTVVTLVAVLAAMDFNRAFVVFHGIFFPGKDNWVFNRYQDQIIRVLPQQFFMNCAIFIGTGLLGQCAAILIPEFCRKKDREASL